MTHLKPVRDKYSCEITNGPERFAHNAKEQDIIEVEVYYSKGGTNYFARSVEGRGIYVSISPATITTLESGNRMKGFGMFSGLKAFIHPCKAKSPKILAEIAARVDGFVPEAAQAFIASGKTEAIRILKQAAIAAGVA